MLVNFALECLGTEVTSDKVSSDGYEPRNLLRQGGLAWNHSGFLAERFIKPPVTLTFKLPCPVNIKSIILDPKVGSQRSSVIEIYSAADFRMNKLVSGFVTQQVAHRSPKANVADSPQTKSEPVFRKIGSVRCLEPGQICFYNPCFNADGSPAVDHSHEPYIHHSELRHHQAALLFAMDSLAIRIVGTANSSVAAVGRLEIWGVPARSCPSSLRQDVILKYNSAVSCQGSSGNSDGQQATNIKDKNMKNSTSVKKILSTDKQAENSCCHFPGASQNSESQVHIPDEFLDALTFEIMSMPMLLPSGQCVDLSTLDRFSETEANYGRQPSDPFTGLTFTATRKPVVNSALKVSIDHFLMKHADEPSLCHVPRVLGHALPSSSVADCHHGYSAGNDHSVRENSLFRSGTASNVRNLKRTVDNASQQPSQAKHTVDNTSQQTPQTVQRSCDFTNKGSSSSSSFSPAHKRIRTETGASVAQSAITCSTSEVPSSQSAAVSRIESHEERLRSTLRSSLESVLGRLPSFTSPTGQQAVSSANMTVSEEQCSKCQTKLKHSDAVIRPRVPVVVYKFPCDHLVCRACLLKAGAGMSHTNITCSVCCKQFARSDLVRTHV